MIIVLPLFEVQVTLVPHLQLPALSGFELLNVPYHSQLRVSERLMKDAGVLTGDDSSFLCNSTPPKS